MKSWNVADINSYQNSKRHYKNVEYAISSILLSNTFQNNLEEFEMILRQVSLVPSIDIQHIYLNLTSQHNIEMVEWNQIAEILTQYSPNLNEITIKLNLWARHYLKDISNKICSAFKMYKVTYELHILSEDIINVCEINQQFNYPKKIGLPAKIFTDKVIENVESLTVNTVDSNVSGYRWFAKLKALNVHIFNFHDFEGVILINRETLRNLTFHVNEYSRFQTGFVIPCQLRTFRCDFESALPEKLLASQRNLRNVSLRRVKLTKSLLETFSKQTCLSEMYLNDCELNDSLLQYSLETLKFEFVKNLFHIDIAFKNYLYSVIMFVKHILYNADKVNCLRLRCKAISKSLLKFLPSIGMTKKLLSNLNILKIHGREMSEFVSLIIEAPNLVECHIDYIPELLSSCKRLKNLNIGIEVDLENVISILKNIPSLEIFHFKMRNTNHFEETLEYILCNLNNIMHFKLSLHRSEEFGISETKNIVEKTLNDLGKSCNLEKAPFECGNLFYRAEKFSFEIYLLEFQEKRNLYLRKFPFL